MERERRLDAWRWGRASAIAAALVVWMVVAAACAAPSAGSRATLARVYVASAGDGTILELAAPSGRQIGRAVPTGLGLEGIRAGPAGSLLVVSRTQTADSSVAAGHSVALLSRAEGGNWARKVLRMDRASGLLREPLVAADGGRWAAVAYVPWDGAGGRESRCALALVDALAGNVVRELAVCGEGESIRALAVDSRGDDAAVYAAVVDEWRLGGHGGARLVALSGRTGQAMATVPLWGIPIWLGLGPAEGGAERRLHGLEGRGGPERDTPEPYEGRLVAFRGETLIREGFHALDAPASRIALSPAGEMAYALEGYDVLALDLRSGQSRRLTQLPERGLALAVDAQWVYVATAYGSVVERIDRKSGVRGRPLPVGPGPVGLVLAP